MSKVNLMDAFEIERSTETFKSVDDYEIFKDKELLDKLSSEIIESLIDRDITNSDAMDLIIKEEINSHTVGTFIDEEKYNYLYNLIDNEFKGYGPLTELIGDKNVTEIMVNGPKNVFVGTNGNISKDNSVSFINDDHIIRTVNRMLESHNRVIDVKNPIIDIRLSTDIRLNAVIPPISEYPVVTIYIHNSDSDNIEEYIRTGSMTPYMARYLHSAIMSKLNIVITGTNNTGKSKLLNALCDLINDEERIITIEDARELNIKKPHLVSLESNDIAPLINNAMRMNADRLILGSLDNTDSFAFLDAMNSGLEGAMSTLTSLSASDGLFKIKSMYAINNPELTSVGIDNKINSTIDLFVHVDRLKDGKRKVTSISELCCVDKKLVLKDIFAYVEDSKGGEYILYNEVPNTYLKMKSRGCLELDDIFSKIKHSK